MTDEKRPQRNVEQTTSRPPGEETWQFGYQPEDVGPVNVSNLKPPTGGTAVEPAQRPVTKESQ